MRFMVDKVALEHVFSVYFGILLPLSFHLCTIRKPINKKLNTQRGASPINTHTQLLVAVTGRTKGGGLPMFQKAVFFQKSGCIG